MPDAIFPTQSAVKKNLSINNIEEERGKKEIYYSMYRSNTKNLSLLPHVA